MLRIACSAAGHASQACGWPCRAAVARLGGKRVGKRQQGEIGRWGKKRIEFKKQVLGSWGVLIVFGCAADAIHFAAKNGPAVCS